MISDGGREGEQSKQTKGGARLTKVRGFEEVFLDLVYFVPFGSGKRDSQHSPTALAVRPTTDSGFSERKRGREQEKERQMYILTNGERGGQSADKLQIYKPAQSIRFYFKVEAAHEKIN